jgi:hypothetical protein
VKNVEWALEAEIDGHQLRHEMPPALIGEEGSQLALQYLVSNRRPYDRGEHLRQIVVGSEDQNRRES